MDENGCAWMKMVVYGRSNDLVVPLSTDLYDPINLGIKPRAALSTTQREAEQGENRVSGEEAKIFYKDCCSRFT